MATIEVTHEREGTHHWTYAVRVVDGADSFDHEVTLSFQDYDHWTRGRVAPSRAVNAAFEFLLSREPASSILPRFDCSVIRRYFPEVDQELPKLL
jgi:hypothetical protein